MLKNFNNLLAGLFLVGTLLTAVSCQKEDTRPACEKNNTGTFVIDSYKNDPYKVYLDGAYKGTVAALGKETYTDITSGSHATKYVQASGYILYPTEYTLSVTITNCNTFSADLR